MSVVVVRLDFLCATQLPPRVVRREYACGGKSGGRRAHTAAERRKTRTGPQRGKQQQQQSDGECGDVTYFSGISFVRVCDRKFIALQNGRQHEHMPQSSRRPWKTKIAMVATSVRRASRSPTNRAKRCILGGGRYRRLSRLSQYQKMIIIM